MKRKGHLFYIPYASKPSENFMTENKYQNELWDEIPGTAFIALGRRGREAIDLHQCFAPGCSENNRDNLHVIEKSSERIKDEKKSVISESVKFTIHCDTCKSDFKLIFERFLDSDSNEDQEEESAIYENVYATSQDETENYGQIGFVQSK